MRKVITISLLLLGILNQSCRGPVVPRFQYEKAGDFLKKAQFAKENPDLKAHLEGGDLVFLFNNWRIDTVAGFISGEGQRFDYNRHLIKEGDLKFSMDSVLIYEMNEDLELADGVMALIPLAIVNVAVSLACITNPKACFGSCPTFYTEDGNVFEAKGEGFSNAIAPSLEYGDVDDLKTSTRSSNFKILMKNEAQETHCLKAVELWALPISNEQSALMTRDKSFYSSSQQVSPSSATVAEKDVLSVLLQSDREEYFSAADADNLASKEELILEFDASELKQEQALLLDFRQSLMTTYFIYSAMAYMGDEVSDIFAKIEREKDLYSKLDNGLKSELGELEVYLWNEELKEWQLQGALYETGPIAVNRQIVPLQKLATSETVRVKLLMNKGLWRLDYAALASLDKKLEPLKLQPSQLKKNGSKHSFAKQQLLDSEKHLISLPGDFFELEYELPDANRKYALHLYSKGYYMEWMRKEWLGDKDLLKLNQMMNHPRRYLKREADAYKEYELVMEEVFWSSQIESKKVSSYEN
tara:strand:- start:16697 stop:18280 length:1584 start_codon:yes stop_codon:yes gene_type:complete